MRILVHNNGFGRYGDYDEWKILMIITNLSTQMICKNGLSIINTSSCNLLRIFYIIVRPVLRTLSL